MSEGQVGGEGEGQEQGEQRERERGKCDAKRDSFRVACGRERERERGRGGERATLGEQDRALLLAQPLAPFPRTSCFGFNMPTLGTHLSLIYVPCPRKSIRRSNEGHLPWPLHCCLLSPLPSGTHSQKHSLLCLCLYIASLLSSDGVQNFD